jgi:hypothetical protein
MSAASFLHHRQSALHHFKLAEDAPADAAAARHHLRAALALASNALAVDVAATRAGGGKEEAARLWPLVATAAALTQCLAALNAKANVLFDPELARWELELAAAAEAFTPEPAAPGAAGGSADGATAPPRAGLSGSSPLLAPQESDACCAACGSTQELDEDVDSPGTQYCVPCWLAYDTGVLAEGAAEYAAAGVADTVATAAAAALQDAAVAAALGRGVHAYTVNELLALRAAHCAPPDAAPACFLGLQDAAAVSAMLARLPQPWSEKAPSGNSSSGGGGGGGGSAGNKGSQRKRNAAKKEERQVKPKDSLCGDNSNGRELSGGSAASEGQVSAGSENTGAAVYEPSPASVNKNTDHEMAK